MQGRRMRRIVIEDGAIGHVGFLELTSFVKFERFLD